MKLYDTKAIARFLDISERRVRQLRDEKVIEEYKRGLYDLIPTIHNYINYLRKSNPDSEEKIDYNTERAKLVKIKRENEELDLKFKKNQVHSSEEVESVMSDMLINFKSRLMSIPAKLSPGIAKKTDKTEIFKTLKESIDEALNELADFKTVFGERIKDNEESDD